MGDPFILAEDYAIKTLCQGMTVYDDAQASRPVRVWFGYPDIEVRDQTFPFITIDLVDIIPANNRQTAGVMYDGDYQGTVAPSGDNSYSYTIPVAYDLVYQVTSHARHPRHDRALMYQLLNKFPSKYGKLAVPNQLGTETVNRSMFLDGFVKRDTADSETGNRRLLRNTLTVRVVSEMSPYVAAQLIPAVETVVLDTISYTLTGNYENQ
jgi:hypothetical protein